MTGRESLALAVAAACSVSTMGWIVWSERPAPALPSHEPAAPAAGAHPRIDPQLAVREVDEARVADLEAAAESAPDDASPRVSLGDLYVDARRFEEAIPWYEQALSLEPSQPHALLNLGIARAVGLRDLQGALSAWEQVVEIAPDGPEAAAARELLGRMRAAHDAQAAELP